MQKGHRSCRAFEQALMWRFCHHRVVSQQSIAHVEKVVLRSGYCRVNARIPILVERSCTPIIHRHRYTLDDEQVKAPGVTKDMVGRWQSKDGRLDCSSMDYVPFCGVSLEEKCGQTYTVQSGIGCILSLDIPCTLSQPALTFPCLFLDSSLR